VQHFAGGTVLPTGRVAMILNAAELIRSAADRAQGAALTDRPQAPAPTRRRILVSDDSVTVRTSLKLLLEPAGYDVVLAVDGQEAWQLLEERGADLVISDVEMPRMDGFALTEQIRRSRRLQALPVILLTALENDAHRARGLQVGANAYLFKSVAASATLLQTIAQLL
jgi:two-component system chemotaxis sensor kinase CheA